MTTTRNFRLVVLDWDGTVMDSSATIVGCMRQSLLDVGIEEPPGEDTLRGGIGLGLDSMVARLLPQSSPELRSQVIERYRHHWLSGFKADPELFDGARAAIEELKRRGHWLAVATGKGRSGLDRELGRTGLGAMFLTTRTVNESPSKPNPQMLLDVLADLGVAPADALMVGDTTFDLEMAHHAGVASVGVLCGSHDRPTLETWNPLTCLDDLAALPGWLA